MRDSEISARGSEAGPAGPPGPAGTEFTSQVRVGPRLTPAADSARRSRVNIMIMIRVRMPDSGTESRPGARATVIDLKAARLGRLAAVGTMP